MEVAKNQVLSAFRSSVPTTVNDNPQQVVTQSPEMDSGQPSSDEFVKEGMSAKKKILIATGVLAAAVAAGLLIYSSVKKGRPLTIDAFKQAGNKFDKGVATMTDGSKFTGTLNQANKNGDKFIIEYANGLLKQSSKNVNPNGTVNVARGSFIKTYTHNADGKLVEIKKVEQVLDESAISRTVLGTDKITHYKGDKVVKETLTPTGQAAEKAQEEALRARIKAEATKRAEEEALRARIKAEATKRAEEEALRARIKAEATKRATGEKIAQERADAAQSAFNKPFEGKLANKSAEESAKALQDAEIKPAQDFYNKLSKDKLANKSAEGSAGVFSNTFEKEETITTGIARKINEGGISRWEIDDYVRRFGGYTPVEKTVRCSNGKSVNIIYEGYMTDITSDGEILQKVRWGLGTKTKHIDITPDIINNLKLREKMMQVLQDKACEVAAIRQDQVIRLAGW